MNTKDDINEILKNADRAEAPDFLEEKVMDSVAQIERKKVRRVSLTNIAVFTGLAAILLFVSLALQLYVPNLIWLYEVKMYVAVILSIYVVFITIQWLPSVFHSLMKSSR